MRTLSFILCCLFIFTSVFNATVGYAAQSTSGQQTIHADEAPDQTAGGNDGASLGESNFQSKKDLERYGYNKCLDRGVKNYQKYGPTGNSGQCAGAGEMMTVCQKLDAYACDLYCSEPKALLIDSLIFPRDADHKSYNNYYCKTADYDNYIAANGLKEFAYCECGCTPCPVIDKCCRYGCCGSICCPKPKKPLTNLGNKNDF